MTVSEVGSLDNHTATTGSAQDLERERDLFQLMGQLEQILVRLDTVSDSKRLPGSIEIAKEILVELVEFSDNRLGQDSAEDLIGQVCDFHESTKRFERLLGGQSWTGFAAFIGIKTSYSDEAKAMFQQLGQQLLEIVGGFFELFESRFESRDQASEWHAGSKVFLDDLVRRWNVEGRARSFK